MPFPSLFVTNELDIEAIYRYNRRMQNVELQQLIEASTLFRDVLPHELAAIIARLQPSHYAAGTHILERGVWHGWLHLIASGHASVLLENRPDGIAPSAREQYVVARLGIGECFGEMSLITGELPTATIRADQDVTLWSLSQTDFLTLIGMCPTLLRNINAILTRRLSRTNQHILAQRQCERIWLACLEQPDALKELALAVHIADALAACTYKRVLLLELCGCDVSAAARFAIHTGQTRPTLYECAHDAALIQKHANLNITSAGQPFAALTFLALTQEQAHSLDADILSVVTDLAIHYDYILLVTAQNTPTHMVQAVKDQSQKAIVVVSSDGERNALQPFIERTALQPAVFIAHVVERPTIAVQDKYAEALEYPVTRLLPADDALLKRCWQQQQTLQRAASGAELSKVVHFVARSIARQTVGIAFGGGGARGFAHLGVLDGLLQHGVPIDYISACSSGLITPGMYLIGKSVTESEEIFLDIQRHIVQWRIPRTSIFSNRGLKRMLREICGELRFEDLTTPFAMVAVDLTTRAGVVLERGPLWQAALASVALPGIFPPVIIGEHILMDAGMHDPVPIRLVRKMGADILLASELGGQEPPALESATPWLREVEQKQQGRFQRKEQQRSPHMLDLLLRTYDLAMATIGMHSIREADIVFRPKLHRVSLRQFSEGRKFVSAGRDAVEQAMPALKVRLPWL
ncbi:MAG TPA: cyclic nucleotide-binding and patatin-like phospholipase domain-containing protein [Ktedonobacteraceae bacterium]|nr:cyclic nucleotide-binding and patatin-like phospholipase domain-containing protein [Ktedonobacteraceae bacterium]